MQIRAVVTESIGKAFGRRSSAEGRRDGSWVCARRLGSLLQPGTERCCGERAGLGDTCAKSQAKLPFYLRL